MKRYFLIAYTAINPQGNVSHGNATIETSDFLSNAHFRRQIESSTNLQDVVISNIYRFESELDYRHFTA
jgi:hypothetical protein